MTINKLSVLIGLGFGLAAGGAHAAGALSVSSASAALTTQSFASNDGGVMVTDGFANGELSFVYGVLGVSGLGNTGPASATVTFTYLGSGAGYTNSFAVNGSTDFSNNGSTKLGASVSEVVSQNGALNFAFATASPAYSVANQGLTGSAYGADEGVFGIASGSNGQGLTVGGQSYQYVLLYNDPVAGGDHDYNDLVVGVNLVAAVPEPETYAMFLAGLGLMGAVARRRRRA